MPNAINYTTVSMKKDTKTKLDYLCVAYNMSISALVDMLVDSKYSDVFPNGVQHAELETESASKDEHAKSGAVVVV